jgi:hypothetical protein
MAESPEEGSLYHGDVVYENKDKQQYARSIM